MKRLVLSIFALAAITTSAFAQSSPFEWKSGNTKVKIGGFVRFNVNADINSSIGQSNDFVVPNITEADSWDDSRLGFDPSATRLSMELTQSTDALGDVKVYVEGDFRGSGSTLRLRQAYVEAKGFLAGFAWSFMSDLAANAPTIDINGVGSRTFLRTQMIGYRTKLSETLSAGVALEMPSYRSMFVGDFAAVNQMMPSIPLYIQSKSELGHLKASAVINTLQYADEVEKERFQEIGWGAQLSGTLNATKLVKLYGQAIYGEGIDKYISDAAGQSIGMMSTNGKDMQTTPMGGFSAGVSVKLAKNWSLAASGSLVENYGDKKHFTGLAYKSSSYYSATLFYTPAPHVTLGVESLAGIRENFGGDSCNAHRISFMVKYTL